MNRETPTVLVVANVLPLHNILSQDRSYLLCVYNGLCCKRIFWRK